MKFSAITTILSLAALAIAAPSVEVSARGKGGVNGYASSCNQKGGSAYCCNQVTPAGSVSSTIPVNLNVLVQCVSLILSSPICGTATVCCTAAPQSDPALVGVLNGAQVCLPITA